MAAKYSRVERRVWRDERVRRLSRGARELWLYLLTCDAHGGFPGLFMLRLSQAAEDLEAGDHAPTVAEVRAMFAEIEEQGMAHRDAATSVVWLPNAIRKHAENLSVNNVKGWRNAWDDVPDCTITRASFECAVHALTNYEGKDGGRESSAALVAAFTKRAPAWFNAPSPKGSAPAMPIPETPFEHHSNGSGAKDHDQFEPPSNHLRTPFEPPSNKDRTGEGQEKEKNHQSAGARARDPVAVDVEVRLRGCPDVAASAVDVVRLADRLRTDAAAAGIPPDRLHAALAYALDELAVAVIDDATITRKLGRYLSTIVLRVGRPGVLEADLAAKAKPPVRRGDVDPDSRTGGKLPVYVERPSTEPRLAASMVGEAIANLRRVREARR